MAKYRDFFVLWVGLRDGSVGLLRDVRVFQQRRRGGLVDRLALAKEVVELSSSTEPLALEILREEHSALFEWQQVRASVDRHEERFGCLTVSTQRSFDDVPATRRTSTFCHLRCDNLRDINRSFQRKRSRHSS